MPNAGSGPASQANPTTATDAETDRDRHPHQHQNDHGGAADDGDDRLLSHGWPVRIAAMNITCHQRTAAMTTAAIMPIEAKV